MTEIIVKILSGDIFSVKVEESSFTDNVVKELNKINPIQFPLGRTHLVSDKLDKENKENIYYAYIDTELYLNLTHRSIVYTDYNGFDYSDQLYTESNLDFDEGFDGKILDEWRGFTSLKVRFDMSNSTMYRLFVYQQ